MPAKCTPTPGKITFGPTAPICGPKGIQQPGSPKAGGTSMKPTICDPEQRTVNTAAECGSAEDFFQHSPVSAALPSLSRGRPRSDPRICCRHQWRAPGYAPVIDSCGTAGGRLPGQGSGGYGAGYVNTTHSKIGDLGSKTLPVRDTGVVWKTGKPPRYR